MEEAIPIIQSLGIVAVINQIGFNWTAFYRAIGDTRPIAVGGLAMALGVTGLALPLLLTEGLQGYAVGMGLAATVLLAVRLFYLRRLFSLRPIAGNVARGLFPVAVAFTVTGGARIFSGEANARRFRPLLNLPYS